MGNIKILIAENDEDEQFFMRDGFDKSLFFQEITFAGSGDELLSRLREMDPPPDLILSDLNMPGKNGYDILKELKSNEQFAAIPVVMTSTTSQRSVIDTCMRLGATKFLQKPDTFIEYAEYARQLAAVLDHHKSDTIG